MNNDDGIFINEEHCVKNVTENNYKRLFPPVMSTSIFLRLYLLYLLKIKEAAYGKQLIDIIDERFGEKWRPSHGMVYPMLRSMETEGLIDGYWEDDELNPHKTHKTKRIYYLTNKGKMVLIEELEIANNMFIDSYNFITDVINDFYNITKPKLPRKIKKKEVV